MSLLLRGLGLGTKMVFGLSMRVKLKHFGFNSLLFLLCFAIYLVEETGLVLFHLSFPLLKPFWKAMALTDFLIICLKTHLPLQ